MLLSETQLVEQLDFMLGDVYMYPLLNNQVLSTQNHHQHDSHNWQLRLKVGDVFSIGMFTIFNDPGEHFIFTITIEQPDGTITFKEIHNRLQLESSTQLVVGTDLVDGTAVKIEYKGMVAVCQIKVVPK